MSEFDELRKLRDADPVDPTSIPSLDDDGPRALRERILMNTPTTTTKRWSRSAIAATGIASVAAAAIAFAVTSNGDKAGNSGPITPDPGMAMCVASYDLDTLKDREVAFDGTVTSVDGDTATFSVNEWFRGGDGASVTLEGASGFGNLTSVGNGVAMDPGSRMLVAGDGGFAWNCGFTQAYDANVAASWRTALA